MARAFSAGCTLLDLNRNIPCTPRRMGIFSSQLELVTQHAARDWFEQWTIVRRHAHVNDRFVTLTPLDRPDIYLYTMYIPIENYGEHKANEFQLPPQYVSVIYAAYLQNICQT